uniref:Endonuclease/exonuclease/phosphatase domain-containing protein n=1 Tax=Setaria viridis TaxID=4556 RepID=A0A4U6VY44_SETVI|nr:hypothetical protein SEVIR_2G339200v2 [Setaria viridis]
MAGIKFLTYNVWSCEHVAVYRRIRAICEIIERHDPDVIFLQTHHRLRAATCSLACPNPSDIGSVHRRARAGAFLEHFDAVHHQPYERSFVLDGNVVLGGDLGWDDDLDGPLRLGDEGWVDAWRELRGGDEDTGGGWTYDAVANPMLRGLNLPAERRRPDRFICKLRDFKLGSIEMVGVEPIPGVTRFDDKGNVLPVLPSHHFGLLLTISRSMVSKNV